MDSDIARSPSPSPEAGLTSAEARARLVEYGFNEIPEKRDNPLKDFLRRYWGPMPWLLETAMGLSLALDHPVETAMIFAILTLNAVIGFRHSRGSQKAIGMLKAKLAPTARALRDGSWITIPSKETVPGDVIVVKMGEIVPADSVVLSGSLAADQSSITGESYPVDILPGGRAFSGSAVRRGEARCLVEKTGGDSFMGNTAKLVDTARHASHQEEVMLKIVKYMMFLGIGASLLVAGYALLLHIAPVVVLTFIVIFLMGAVPVALPAVLTIVQSVGALELSRNGAVVSRLEAIEDAASIDTICFDKTGTITKNDIGVSDAWTAPGHSREELLLYAALASSPDGDEPIDAAVRKEAGSRGISLAAYTVVAYEPFDNLKKRTEARVEKGGELLTVLKGYPPGILRSCGIGGRDDSSAATEAVSRFSARGFRSIAVAAGGASGEGMGLVGLIAFSDAIREDSAEMIRRIKELGIRPLMLTGDGAAIGAPVAESVGIGGRLLDAEALARLDGDRIAELIADADGVAGIFPEDKFNIVRALQGKGHLVGMTGDGVNDAPALKQAEMGIAVDKAADVAKSAAGIVLAEPGLAVIVHAVETSRKIYQRMLSWVLNKIIKVISFVGLLTASFLWLGELPLSMLGMSLLVFANDFATMSLATDTVARAQNPNRWKVGTITFASIVPGALFMLQGLGAIALCRYAFRLGMPELKSVLLLNLVFSSQFRVLIVRERGHFWDSLPGKQLMGTSAAMILAFCLMGSLGLLMAPVSIPLVLGTLGYSAIASLLTDFPKFLSFKLLGIQGDAVID